MGGPARESFRLNIAWRRLFKWRTWRYAHNRKLLFEDNIMPLVCLARGHVPFNTSTIHEPIEYACSRCHRWLSHLNPPLTAKQAADREQERAKYVDQSRQILGGALPTTTPDPFIQPQPTLPQRTRHQYFVARARELGAYDSDADYGGQIGRDIEAISALIESQHHSGGSFVQLYVLFRQLVEEWHDEDRRPK